MIIKPAQKKTINGNHSFPTTVVGGTGMNAQIIDRSPYCLSNKQDGNLLNLISLYPILKFSDSALEVRHIPQQS